MNIYKLNGQLMDSLPVKSGNSILQWNNSVEAGEILFFQLNSPDGRLLAATKVIVTK